MGYAPGMNHPPLLSITARLVGIGELPTSAGECVAELEYEDPTYEPEDSDDEDDVEILNVSLPCSESQAQGLKAHLFQEVRLTITPAGPTD